jgi:hypothetical protein
MKKEFDARLLNLPITRKAGTRTRWLKLAPVLITTVNQQTKP